MWGVGSGFFLDHAQFASAAPRIVLMDMSRDALAFAARRLSRYSPETRTLCWREMDSNSQFRPR